MQDIRSFFGGAASSSSRQPPKRSRDVPADPGLFVSWNADGLLRRNEVGTTFSDGSAKGGLLPKVLQEKLTRIPDIIAVQETWAVFDPPDGKEGLRGLLVAPARIAPPPPLEPEVDSLGFGGSDGEAEGAPSSVNVKGMLDGHTNLLPKAWIPEFEHCYWSCNTARHAGTAMLSRIEPLSVSFDLPDVSPELAQEGRFICLEFQTCFAINVYVPNTGKARLDLRTEQWDRPLLAHMIELEKRKPVICMGDFNVCPSDRDLTHPTTMGKSWVHGATKNPDPRYKPTAGLRQLERDGFQNMMADGFVDAFRHLHPTSLECSWRQFAGDKKGMRLDFYVVSQSIASQIAEATMFAGLNQSRELFCGSDHCAITLQVNHANMM
jgi:exodeoxyribonuclease-3